MWNGLAARLEGRIVTLEPLRLAHADALWEVAQHREIWRWMRTDCSQKRSVFDSWIAAALAAQERGEEVAFATLDARDGSALGSTRYLTLRPDQRGLEIGHTWLAPARWSTGANKEAKLLLLTHAFERHGCIRVEFKTDALNDVSRRALAAIPAQFEGVLRRHMLSQRGRYRDSAYYSVISDDWPAVRSNLERRVAQL